MQVVNDHPQASEFAKAEFDVLNLHELPRDGADYYAAVGGQIVELGPLSGEGEKHRRQVRVADIDSTTNDRSLALMQKQCCQMKLHWCLVCYLYPMGSRHRKQTAEATQVGQRWGKGCCLQVEAMPHKNVH